MLKFQIPRGTDTGDTIKIEREREVSEEGGLAGGLYIGLQVKPHPIFTRRGSDIHAEKGITIIQGMLGRGVKNVPTLVPLGEQCWSCSHP